MESLKLSVRWFLLFAVEELLGSATADLPLNRELSALSRADHRALAAADRIAKDAMLMLNATEARDTRELHWAHRKLAAAMLRDLRINGSKRVRLALASRHLPADLRSWGRAQLKRAQSGGFSIAYIALTLENAIAFEAVHEPEWQDPSALAEVAREYVEWHTFEFDSGVTHVPAKKRRDIPQE